MSEFARLQVSTSVNGGNILEISEPARPQRQPLGCIL